MEGQIDNLAAGFIPGGPVGTIGGLVVVILVWVVWFWARRGKKN
ncbi:MULTISPECIES: hypothetical protein [Streptomycetaceae]|nr:hypothetical protein [Streptomyces sp. SID3343]